MAANTLITPEKIRLFMLDRTAADNFLLDDVDMPSDLMDLCMELTVDDWNTSSPFLGETLTVETFPYKLEFLLGVVGRLLKSKGMNLMRNALNYQSSSGTSVDDKTVASQYIALGSEYLAEFQSRIRAIKQHLNIEQGFGYVSGYGRKLF